MNNGEKRLVSVRYRLFRSKAQTMMDTYIKVLITNMNHIVEMGFDALFLSPFYKKSFKDCGFDISGHKEIDAKFGNKADVDELSHVAERLKLMVAVDFVPNRQTYGRLIQILMITMNYTEMRREHHHQWISRVNAEFNLGTKTRIPFHSNYVEKYGIPIM